MMPIDDARKPRLLFIGSAPELAGIRDEATALGFTVVDAFSADVECAIVSEEVLDRRCSPDDAVTLCLAESAGVQLVSPREARDFLRTLSDGVSGARRGGHPVSTNPGLRGMRIIDTTL